MLVKVNITQEYKDFLLNKLEKLHRREREIADEKILNDIRHRKEINRQFYGEFGDAMTMSQGGYGNCGPKWITDYVDKIKSLLDGIELLKTPIDVYLEVKEYKIIKSLDEETI